MAANSLRARLTEFWYALPPNSRGAVWIIAAAACFSLMAVCVKAAGRTLPVFELIVLRTVFAVLFLTPLCYRVGRGVLVTRHWKPHIVRSVLGIGGAASFYFAVAHLELALVTTLGFTRTLFIIVLALIFLGEVIRWRRSLATAVGFVGVLICMQPGTASFDPWTLAGLSFALFAAGVTTAIKRLTVTESPLTILIYTYLLMGVIALVPALLTWHAPDATELCLMALIAAFSIIAQGCVIQGLKIGELTALAPFEYSRLLFAALFGYLFFAEVAGLNTWMGAAVIVMSTLYIALREAQLGRREDSPES